MRDTIQQFTEEVQEAYAETLELLVAPLDAECSDVELIQPSAEHGTTYIKAGGRIWHRVWYECVGLKGVQTVQVCYERCSRIRSLEGAENDK